jgi:leucyl/phenylalanyl-tRNA--protein transferase
MLLSAYSQGVFPWYSEGEPILWWSPDPRFVLFPEQLHVSKSLRKKIRKCPFDVSFDSDFEQVMRRCAETPRRGQSGTWITEDMIDGYVRLYELGFAHSVEVKRDGNLVGGLYGVSLGGCFFGESMFSKEPDASKVGFVVFVRTVVENGISLIDSQVYTQHLARFGAREIPRSDYLKTLEQLLEQPTIRGDWGCVMTPRFLCGETP